MRPNLSVIIPIKNELKLNLLPLILKSYQSTQNIELIWVSAPSNDGTVEFLMSKQQNVIQTQINNRAGRINLGIRKAKSQNILINHPRSYLKVRGIEKLLIQFDEDPNIWGGFTHQFINNNHKLLQFTSYYSNKQRFDRSGIVHLDHCLFFNKSLIMNDQEPVPDVPIFEGLLFSKKLLKFSKPMRLPEYSRTSAVRFETNGIFKQSYLNQKLKWQYYFGKPLNSLNKKYEKGLDLNSNY